MLQRDEIKQNQRDDIKQNQKNELKQFSSSSPSWNLELLALFPRRGLPQEAQKGHRNPHSCSKMHALFPRRKPPRQAQKGHRNPHSCSKMHALSPLRKPPRQPQKGHRNPHFYCNVSPMTIFFGNQAVLPHCFFNVSFCSVFPNKKKGIFFCLDAFAQRLLQILWGFSQ